MTDWGRVFSDMGKAFLDPWGVSNPATKVETKDSYSDNVGMYNDITDGWYSTIMDSLPIIRNIHGAMLDRDKAEDYLKNNHLSWSDIIGYNFAKVQSSANMGSLASSGTSWLSNNSNDLGKLYSGQTNMPRMSVNGKMVKW